MLNDNYREDKLKEETYQHSYFFVGIAITLAVALTVAGSTVLLHWRKLKNVTRAKDAFSYIDNDFLQISSTKEEVESIFNFLYL